MTLMSVTTATTKESSSHHNLKLNCAGESKTGTLTLLAGSFQKTTNHQNNNNNNVTKQQQLKNQYDVKMMLRHKLLMSYPSEKLPGNRRAFGSRQRQPAGQQRQFPRQVRVSLFSKVASSPYLVIFDSNNKYAKPLTCVRLNTCHVTNDDVTNEFRLILGGGPHHVIDADQSQQLVFRAGTTDIRDSWVRSLRQHCRSPVTLPAAGCCPSPGLRRHATPARVSTLPTVLEHDDVTSDDDDDDDDVTSRPETTTGTGGSLDRLVGPISSFEIRRSQAARIFAS